MKMQRWIFVIWAIMSVLWTDFFAGISNPINKLSGSNVTLWKFKTSGKIMATPLIDNGILYIGSLDSTFYAIDALTGMKKWSYKTQNQIYGNAVIYQNIIVFESGNVLYGLTLQGTLSWKFTIYDGSFLNMQDEWDYYHSSPCLVGNVVYIGSEKGLVYGIDARNGGKVFQCQTPSAKYVVKTTPAVFDNKIYFGDWDGVFYAYDISTATLVWQYNTKQDNSYSGWVNAIVTDPLVVNGFVYFGGRNCNLYSLDVKTGTKKWMFHDNKSMWVIGGPVVNGGIIFTGSSYQHVVRAFDINTGKLIWETNVDYRVNGKPLIVGENVYVGTEHDTDIGLGTIAILDKNTGAKKGRLNMGAQVYSSPVLSNGTIYAGAIDEYIYAYKQSDLLSIYYPDIYLQCPDIIDLNKLKNNAPFNFNITVYNRGNGPDSVVVGFSSRTSLNAVKAKVGGFKLAAHDSQKVSILIDPTILRAGYYSYIISFNSLWALESKSLSRAISFTVEETTGVEAKKSAPISFLLEQNFPNPFNPETVIEYQLPDAGYITLKVYDALGKEIATLVDGFQYSGQHKVVFNVKSIHGNYQYTSGIYFYRLQAGAKIHTRKLVLIK